MAIKNNSATTTSRRFVIGWVGTMCHWTNWPVWENPTNDNLLNRPTAELELLAHNDQGDVLTEKYQRPDNEKEAEAQGGTKGETYYGVCRAMCILQFRKAKELFEDKQKEVVEEHPTQERDNQKALVRAFLEVNPNWKYLKVRQIIEKYSIAPEEVGLPTDAW